MSNRVPSNALTPKPGDFFVIRSKGFFGFLIRLGTRSRVNHAGIVIDNNGNTIESFAKGATRGTLRQGMVFSGNLPLSDHQRERIVEVAHDLEGTPYGFLDILAISLKTFGISFKWLNSYIDRTDRMICSQFVDEVYNRADVHLFDDGRMHQEVTPGDLAESLLVHAWTSGAPNPGPIGTGTWDSPNHGV